MYINYGMPQTRDRCYGVAAALSYWVFKCRDKRKSPAMGMKTWTYLESSIRNSAEISSDLEGYLGKLADKLISHLRPVELTKIINPEQRIIRVNTLNLEIQELTQIDDHLQFMGWLDLIEDIKPHGFAEWDVLDLCRTNSGIVQVICRLKYEEDKALGLDDPEEFIEVESSEI